MVVDHAPVFVPRASTVFAASGMQECTKPAALARTSTLRGCFGLAGAVSGKAAIIFSTSAGLGVWFCGGAAAGGRRRGLRQCGSHGGGKLILRHGAGAVAVGQPFGEGRLQLVARDKAVLIQVDRREDAGRGSSASAATPAGGGLLRLQREGAGAQGRGANTNQQRSCRVFGTHDTSRVTEHRINVHRGVEGLLTIKGWSIERSSLVLPCVSVSMPRFIP